jgi:hypothetical protein
MKTIEQLVQKIISNARFLGIEDVVEAEPWLRAYDSEDWRSYLEEMHPDVNSITLLQNRHARLALIRWQGHYKSEKHGHPERGCLLKVLSGVLLETRYDPVDTDQVIGEYPLFRGDLSFIHDALAYHVVENPLSTPAYSLHLYSPGIYSAKIISAPANPSKLPAKTLQF